MKSMIRCLAFALFAMIIAVPYAFSDDNPMDRCDMMHKHDKMMSKTGLDDMFLFKTCFIMANADEIALTSEQAEKIEALKMSAKKSNIKSNADIELLALDIKSELSKDDVNLDTVNTIIDKKYALKAQKAKDSIAAYINLKKILTDEQRKKLKEMWFSCMKGKTKHKMMEREKVE